ncbi:M1 family aminopeptidase [Nocardioides sp. S-58]|uniref:M1 family aminopeptidase n=1 Tax=Nocardioides renjunii TaxID=3095075 RepID=A0ABU5KAW6_9ACTN|nr:M1 family aminopeptidase [Nocardioides sp. S-58]MDZ5662103.1 M1 family aminopeptidase [Nocardioides sp. S-58]
MATSDVNGRSTWWRRVAARAVPVAMVAGSIVVTATQPSFAADPVDGARTAGDPMFPHVGNGGYDALHYDVVLDWNATGVVGTSMTGVLDSASTTMRARTTGAPLRSFSLDFEGLTVDSVTVDGVPATYERVVDPATTTYKLVVTPAAPFEGDFTTVVTYHGVPNHHVDPDGSWEGWAATSDGATFMGQPVGAMAGIPHNNMPGDKATWSFTTTIPSTITSATGPGDSAVVGNGELASRTVSEDGTRTTWRWVQQEQMASELIIISIGKYDVIESQVTLSDGRVIPEWSFMDSSLSAANKTTITNRRALLGTIITRLEQLYGPYPGNSTGVVVDTVPSGINYALETQDRSFFPSTGSVNGNTLIHELAHQWYGDNVTPQLWTDIWMNEGMATWGPSWHTNVLAPATPNPGATETTYFNSWNNTASTSANWATPPGAQTNPANIYGYQTYTRGAQFWEALRTALRNDDFLEVVREWQTRYAGESRSGEDLKALAEEVSGRDLDAFWQDWILDGDKPAWPSKYDLTLAGEPASTPQPGGTLTYQLTAANVGKVALTDGIVEVDLADVLDDASLGTLPDGLVLDGTTLTWTVPPTAVGSSATATFDVVVDGDVSDETLRATAVPTGLGGLCSTAGCASEAAVGVQPLTPSGTPEVTGTFAVGGTVTVSTPGWRDGTSFSHQWLVDGTPVEGATASNFTLRPDDVGRTVSVAVTGSHPDYSPVTRTSAAATVAAGTLASTPTPTIQGDAVVGATVTAQPGAWDDGAALTYEWFLDSEPVGAGASRTLGAADVGKQLEVAVTATKAGYTGVTRRSAAATVSEGRLLATPAPVVSGTARFGETLTVSPGTWDGGVSVGYQWLRDGVPVGGATGASYVLGLDDVRTRISVAVTGTKPGYAAVTTRSATTSAVARARFGTVVAKIAGKAQVGRTLKARVRGIGTDPTVRYAWYAGTKRLGSTPTLELRRGLLGRRVTLRVTVREAGFVTTTVRSEPTTKVTHR